MGLSEINSYLDTFVNFESQLHKLRPEDFSLNRIREIPGFGRQSGQAFKNHSCGRHQG